ncbi:hypothetical protein X777_11360 [Ooceraea biroi]|uniref:Uncharacterized protein n=1 Tax=Ooceraea biroi TaxID=2015173 RepID=A0A026WY87_OOCBI|nr:hypothetical protein X777_11360 [Ooceraea biroi]
MHSYFREIIGAGGGFVTVVRREIARSNGNPSRKSIGIDDFGSSVSSSIRGRQSANRDAPIFSHDLRWFDRRARILR